MQSATIDSQRVGSAKSSAAPQDFTHPWLPDRGDGTYCNPIIYADYSDPDAIRVGDDFYLVASSFNCTPGLPILHSKDLVNWTLINHAVKNLPDPRYDRVQPGCGVWAPAIRFHDGKFWIFFSMPDEGIYVTTAKNPAGQWSEPHLLQKGKGLIDPCPLWDDDGKAYLIHAYARSRSGLKHQLRVVPMAPDGSRLLDVGEIVFHQPEKHPTLEGPKFYKRDGWYYIFAPAGGVENGWQVVMRSRSIYGPYVDKIVLSQGRTLINGPHQGALIDTPAGGWWFLHFQDAGAYGRIIHLQPVLWQNGWPLMGNQGEPILHHAKPDIAPARKTCAPQTGDEFDGKVLGLQWQWHANHHDDWHSLTVRPGWLRLIPQAIMHPLCEQPNLLLQKFPARSFTVETELQPFFQHSGEEAGLVVAGANAFALGIQRDGLEHWLVMRTPQEVKRINCTNLPSVKIQLEVRDGGLCQFSLQNEGHFVPIGQSFQADKGVWIGAKLGLYSVKQGTSSPAGHVDVDYFRFL